MAQLIVRNLDKGIVDLLRAQAARNGRSAEAEHREILAEALRKHPVRDLKQLLSAMPDVGDDRDFQIPRRRGRRVTL